MKILFVANSKEIGGGNLSLITMAKAFEIQGESVVICSPGKGKFTDYLNSEMITYFEQKTHLYVLPKIQILMEVLKLLFKIKKYDPDIIHVNDIHCYKYFGLVASFFNIAIVCHMRHFITSEQVKFLVDKEPDYFIFNSEYNRLKTLSSLKNAGFLSVPVSVNYNFFYLNDYFKPEKRNILRNKLSIGDDVKVFTLIGNINPLKGHINFINSIKLFSERTNDDNYLFLISGEDVTQSGIGDSCKSLIIQYSLESKVMMIGFQPDAAAVYAASDVIVIPSEEEPFGRVAVEAILARKQVVASKNSGLKEILTPLRTPVLCDKPDPESLCNGYIEIYKKNYSLKDLSKDQLKIQKKFGEEQQLGKLKNLYKKIKR